MPPKRLAFFVPSMGGGGAERATLILAGEIAKRGYAVDLVLVKAEGPYLAEMPELVRVVDLKASRVILSLPALVRYLRQDRPDAMVAMMSHSSIVALWARSLARVPTRTIVVEQVVPNSPRARRPISRHRQRLFPWLVKRFYPWADGIIAVSKGVAKELARITGMPLEDIQVIYNPITRPDLRKKSEAPLDHPWFQPGELPVVLAAGRLNPQKDFPTLLRAFAIVRQTHAVRLVILGQGPERSRLEALVKELGLEQDVSLPGFVDNPYAYMARSTLFVLSSQFEGLPTTLIEAMCCGTPVVSTDCPSGPQEILFDGRYGRLVPVGNAIALAQAIESAFTGDAITFPRESCRRFEVETVADQYLETMLGGRSCVPLRLGCPSA